MAEIIILPVVRIMTPFDGVAPDGAVLAPVIDINAVRYRRERAAIERREMQSLLPKTGVTE